MMPRPVSEWIGKKPESKCPPRVRLRIFDREHGICHICKFPIQADKEKWEADHVPALINGGENRESKLFPAHFHCHKVKTKDDVAEKAKTDAMRMKSLGIKRAKQKIAGRNDLRTEPKARKINKGVLPELQRRTLYKETGQ